MRGSTRHGRRWASGELGLGGARGGAGAAPAPALALSAGSSPMGSAARGSDDGEEFVEVTLDLQDDDTIVLRSVEPAAAPEIDSSTAPGSAGESRSPSIRRSSSHRLLQFSQELRAEAVARARQFSHDLRAELKRFSRSHSRASASSSAPAVDPAIESALAARAARRQRALLDRTRSGAHKALRGLRFISSSSSKPDANAWNEVLLNFDRLARDGFLFRSDFAQCIGPIRPHSSAALIINSSCFEPNPQFHQSI